MPPHPPMCGVAILSTLQSDPVQTHVGLGRKVYAMTDNAIDFPPNMRTENAARYVGLSRSKLEKLRVEGEGPRYSKLGRTVLYRRASLDEWLLQNERTNTSACPEAA